MSNQVRYNIGCPTYKYIYQAKTINYSTLWTIYYYYYVSERQLPPVIDASHTMPITHVNQGPKLLKLIDWRYCPCFMWVPSYPEPRPRLSALNQAVPPCTTETIWDVSHPREPCNGTLSRLIYSRSTQNTDIVSSINFLNPDVSCSITLLFKSINYSCSLYYWNDTGTITMTVTINSNNNSEQ